MIGSFENGQNYRFYVALTDQILDSVRRTVPDRLRYRGMDFSHALECELYFSCVLDEALNALYAGEPASGHPPLSNDLVILLARQWFGNAAKPYERRQSRLLALARKVKQALDWRLAWSAPRPAIAHSALPARCDVLLYARSQRFADYLSPLAERLVGRGGYLVSAQAHDLQRSLAAKGLPFIAATNATVGMRPAYSMIGRYAPHLAFFADGVEAALRRARPRLVLLPEGNSPDDEVLNQVGRKLDIPVVCLQQGWSPILHPGFCNLQYALMLVWGEGFAELLARSSPSQSFTAVGNIALTSDFRAPQEKPPGVLFFHQDMDRGLGGRRGSNMVLELAERIALARPDVPVYYRPHPLVPLDESARQRLLRCRIKIQQPQNCPLTHALDKASITVSIYSTTILESAASGSLPVIFNMTTMPHFWPDIARTGAAIEVRTINDAMTVLQDLLASKEALAVHEPSMRDFTGRFFCARGDQALDNVIEILDKFGAN